MLARHTLTALCVVGWISACSSPQRAGSAGVGPGIDIDADGIPDGWETNGVSYSDPVDGAAKIWDLKAEGASTQRKDILLWVEYMGGAGGGDPSHLPTAAALKLVKDAFSRSPVDNSKGINLIVRVAPTPLAEVSALGSGDVNNYQWSAFDTIRHSRFPSELSGVAFFALFAHDTVADRSGFTKHIPGRDFVVSLGSFLQTDQSQAGTMMHELGHALGLNHGGGDHRKYKPNYLSVMNYWFQLDGVWMPDSDNIFDYSRAGADLDETKLLENSALTADPRLTAFGSRFWCCYGCPISSQVKDIPSVVKPGVDWNCNGTIGATVSVDVNDDQDATLLDGYDDWSNLQFTAGGVTHLLPEKQTSVGSISVQEADAIPLVTVAGVVANRAESGIAVRWSPMRLQRVVAFQVLRSVDAASPQTIAIVENAAGFPSFIDRDAPRGRLSYTVTALYVPHARNPDQPPAELAGGQWLTAPAFIDAVEKAAPVRTARVESLRMGAAIDTRRFSTVLRQTPPSAPGTIVVQ